MILAWEIVTNYKTAAFKKVVQAALDKGSGRVELLLEKSGTGKILYDELGMQILQGEAGYYLAVQKNRYDRLEYEKFLKLARSKGLDLGSNIWLTMQLTFPLEFWSASKQNNILEKIASQQFRFLAYTLKQFL